MNKLKILRLSYNVPNKRYSNDGSVFDQLDKQADVTFINMPGRKPSDVDKDIKQALKTTKYDFIYKNFIKVNKLDTSKMRPLCEWGLPVFVSSGDCHTRFLSQFYNEKSNYHKFNVIIVNNKSTIPHFKKYFDRDMEYIWLPWSYNPEIHKDYKLPKIYNSSIPASYFGIEIRKVIRAYLEKSSKYTKCKGLEPIEYAKRINQCKIAVSTCQKNELQWKDDKFMGMTFNKYYEIPMCGTFHLGQRSADAEDLGFEDDKNIAWFDTYREFISKFQYYLKNEKKRNKILLEARKLIKPMTYENRIKIFLEDAKKLI